MEQEFQERQQEELEVLSAIYLDDFIDLRSKEMQMHKATPEFCLKLTPLQSMVGKDVHAKLDLHIKFTTKYPQDPPIIKLANAKGLSDEQVAGLRKELVQIADKLTGEVMVLQLAQHTQNYLYRHNTPLLSFYEQMMSNQQMQIERKRKEEESRKAQHLAEATEEEIDVIRQVREEMNQRTELIEARKKRNRCITMQKSNSLGQDEPPFRSCQRETKTKVDILSFVSKAENRLIHIGKCCGHHYDDECIRTAFDAQTGEVLSVIEWKYANKSAGRKSQELYQEQIDGTYKQVKSMEQELNILVGKIDHVNVLSYVGYCTSIEDGVVFCRILTEPVPTESLDQEVRGQGLSLETLRIYSKQLVDAMAYLHNKNIVHRDFKLEYIYKQRMDILKVGGYGILKRLADLKSTQQHAEVGAIEDSTQKRISRQGKKGDILNFGLAVLSLAEGKHHVNIPTKHEEGLHPDLENFVNKCIIMDDKERWSFHQLSDHPFLLPSMTSNSVLERRRQDSSHSKDEAVENENESILLVGNLVLTGKSRLKSEFEVLQWLGQGGFGSVVKVRNKLDGKFYAIKKVALNPHNLQLNKRITREVKLLSRLNHENVVRYYTAWIESEDVPPVTESSSDTSASIGSSQKAKIAEPRPSHDPNSEESLLDINAFKAPDHVPDFSSGQVSWYDKSKASNQTSGQQSTGQPSSDSSDDESLQMRPTPLIRSVQNFESSDGISFQVDESMFQFGDLLNSEESEDEAGETQTGTTNSDVSHALQYLYIQMEYYEKNTLRDIIDEGLWQDKDRVWRLFREMVEGLAHVHSQGIIHRDLKPVNIFMDAYEHVKIGDFGLATSHASSKVEGPDLDATCLHSDEKMTGKVGTALYVAPELGSAVSRVKFSQKVDIYSLGIIFFEMCYKPLATGMERVKMIGSLRKPEIVLPPELELKSSSREKSLLKLLLKHNPDERPSSQELLENGYVPPKLEDRHLDEILKHTLNQSNSSLYQRLLSGLFHQSMGPVVEQIYDTDLHGKSETTILEELRVINYVEQVISNIFECHGAIKMPTPLLMPKGRFLPDMDGHITVMDHSGVVLTLPFDSRLNFARFVARNDITNLKRYVIGKVYRDPKLHRAHPREIRECAFDIVTEGETNLVPEAEVLFAGYELIKSFPALEKRHYYVRVSHTLLLQAILTHTGLSEERHHRVVEILQDARGDKMKHGALREFLLDNGITEIGFTRFSQFLNFEGTLSKARELLQVLRKCKGSIGAQAKQAFVDLEIILRHCKDFGIDIPIVIFPSLVYNIKHFSGFMYQFVAENKRKSRHGGVDILAAGGRYDDLIEKFRLPGNSRVFPSAVGISVAVEKIIGSCLDENKAERDPLRVHNECEALVASVGQTTSYTSAIKALRSLWAAKVPASMSYNGNDQGFSPEEIQDYCKGKSIRHLVIIKMDDPDNVKYRTLEQDKFVESKHYQNVSSVVSEISQRISRKLETREVGKSVVESVVAPSIPSSENTDTRVTFVMPEKKKLPMNTRRKYESHMMSTLTPVISQLSVRTEVEVVVVELPSVTVCDIAGHLELSREDEDYEESVTYLVEINHKVPKIYLQRICSTLRHIQPRKPQGKGDRRLIILYTLKDDFFKIIV